jgi:hypothetical protein
MGENMKPILSLVLLALAAILSVRASWATGIDGKWGLGVGVGSIVSSTAEASILRGISDRTAWIFDVSANQSRDNRGFTDKNFNPDTTIAGTSKSESMTIIVGPRLRRFTRPESSFSPYCDAYAHFLDRYTLQTSPGQSQSGRQVGGEAGFAIGVEYFSTRWPFSVAAHTNVAKVTVSHVSNESSYSSIYSGSGTSQVSSGTAFSSVIAFSPSLQVRVYF